MKTSNKGTNLIMKWEQLRLEPYQDAAGVWTIGYGHTRGISSKTPPITKSQAITYLRDDIKITEHYVNLNFQLRQCQFDAVVCLLFNIGFGKFKKYKLFELLKNSPDSKHVSDEWIEFRNSGCRYLRGLLRRRLDELLLYYSW